MTIKQIAAAEKERIAARIQEKYTVRSLSEQFLRNNINCSFASISRKLRGETEWTLTEYLLILKLIDFALFIKYREELCE